MRIEIKVDNVILDTYGDLDDKFFVTEQLYDLRTLDRRKAAYSRQITIPNNQHNSNVLGIYTNEVFYTTSIDSILIIDGIVFATPKLLITSYNLKDIEVILLDGNFELFDRIPDETVRSLNLNSYNFPYTIAGLTAISANTSGPTTARVEYFDEESTNPGPQTGNIFVNTAYRPLDYHGFAFYMKTLFSEICKQAGYTYIPMTGDSIHDDSVLICPVFVPHVDPSSHYAKVDRITTSFFWRGDISTTNPTDIEFNNVVTDASGLWTAYQFTIINSNTYNIRCQLNFDYNRNTNQALYFRMLRNGATIAYYTTNTGITGDTRIIETNISLTAGDVIKMQVQGGYTSPVNFDVIEIFAGSYFEIQEGIESVSGDLVVSNYLPDMNQRKFMTSFASLFNAFIKANPFTKQVELITWDDFLLNASIDLTENVDVDREIDNQLSLPYYQHSKMQYSNDNLSRDDLDFIVNFDKDETLPLYGTILNPIFSGSDVSSFAVTVQFINVPFFEMSYNSANNCSLNTGVTPFSFPNDEDFKPGDWIFDGTNYFRISTVTSKRNGNLWLPYIANYTGDVQIVKIEVNEAAPRFGILDISGGISSWNLTYNAFGASTSWTNVAARYVTFPVTMQYIHDNYYKKMFDPLKTPKVLFIWMNFKAIEFYGLDVLSPVTIKGINGTFYINKIDQFKLDKPCKVELIRINSVIDNLTLF